MKKLADLILGTGVITADSMAAVQLPPPPPQGTASQQQQLASTGSSRDANGLRCELLVTQQWIAAHASAIERVEAGELVVDGSHASRKLSVKLRDGAGETQVQVQYDVPAIGTDREALRQMELMHRRREERALLAVDSEAAAVVRERKTVRQREERKQTAELRHVFQDIISRLERRADRQDRLTLLLPLAPATALPLAALQ